MATDDAYLAGVAGRGSRGKGRKVNRPLAPDADLSVPGTLSAAFYWSLVDKFGPSDQVKPGSTCSSIPRILLPLVYKDGSSASQNQKVGTVARRPNL